MSSAVRLQLWLSLAVLVLAGWPLGAPAQDVNSAEAKAKPVEESSEKPEDETAAEAEAEGEADGEQPAEGEQPPEGEQLPPGELPPGEMPPDPRTPPPGSTPGTITSVEDLFGGEPPPPPPQEDGAVGLSDEEVAEMFGLPSFAEDQPGFIPDLTPSDLMEQGPVPGGPFSTLLGPSQLPSDPSVDVISGHERNPASGLQDNQARVVVPPGGIIRGSTETKQFHIEGGLTIYYSDITITGQTADIDEKNEVAILRGGVQITDPAYTLKTEELLIYFEDKRFQAKGFVQLKKLADEDKSEPDLTLPKKQRLREYFAGQQFELFCSELYYDWDTLVMTALDSVRINHPAFNGSMDRLDYNDETKEYEMSGKPVLEVKKYDWIFENELVAEDDVEVVEAMTDGATKIDCSRVVYSEEAGIAQFYSTPGGEVVFMQPKRSVKAGYIEVNDLTKDFHAESDGSQVVYSQADGEWLFAGGLINSEGVSEELEDTLSGELTTTSDTLTYNFDNRRLELLGSVVINAGIKTFSANEVIHDEQASYFLMRGNVMIQPDAKSMVRAAQVFIDTETDVITLVGLVEGEFESEDFELEQTEQAEAGDESFQAAEGLFSQTGGANVAEGR